MYKFQLIIKYKEINNLYDVLNAVSNNIKNRKVKLEIDFNPIKL